MKPSFIILFSVLFLTFPLFSYHDCLNDENVTEACIRELFKANEFALAASHIDKAGFAEAYQAPPSMGFSSQEYWSGVPLQEKLKSKKMSMCQKDTEASLKGVSTAKSRTS